MREICHARSGQTLDRASFPTSQHRYRSGSRLPTRTRNFGVKILKTLLPDRATHRVLALFLKTLLMVSCVTGCSTRTHSGLLSANGDQLTLTRPGEKRVLRLTDEGEPKMLHQLNGCVVEVEGSRQLSSFRVERWRVMDAGDGSMPYVGVLMRFGAQGQVAIADAQTGRLVRIHPDDSPPLNGQIGEFVLVMGYLVGPDTIRVVGFRSLTR